MSNHFWSIERAQNYLQYSERCPPGINQQRWRAMQIAAYADWYREFYKTYCNPHSDLPF